MEKLIEAKNLKTNFYTYEGVVKALENVCLTVEQGIIFGLVGESGCGKSVTVRSMMRIVQEPGKVEGGSVLLFGSQKEKQDAINLMELSEASMEELRGNRISMIFQEPNAALNPIMSVGDQVAESFYFHRKKSMSKDILSILEKKKLSFFGFIEKQLYARMADNPGDLLLKIINVIPLIRKWNYKLKKESFKRAVKIISGLGIPHADDVAKSYPNNLSGGMKQRIVIAMALACSPELLIADEATSNLDVTIQAQILALLKELKKKEISSILMITHDLGVVAETCDRVGVMYAGTICETADVDDLFSRPHHPYTKALLKSVPRFNQKEELTTIRGNVPNLVSPPDGCRFHPRCPEAMDICRQSVPGQATVGRNHSVACHLWSENKRKGHFK